MHRLLNKIPLSEEDKKTFTEYLEDPVKAVYVQEALVRAYREFQKHNKTETKSTHSQSHPVVQVQDAFVQLLQSVKAFYSQLGIVRAKRRVLEQKIQRKSDERLIADINNQIAAIDSQD